MTPHLPADAPLVHDDASISETDSALPRLAGPAAFRLLLLRHAQAQPPFHVADHERLLTAYGVEQADKAGQWLAATACVPDYALVSTALRTRATFSRLQAHWPQPVAHKLTEAIYEAPAVSLLQCIRRVASEYKTLLLLGHNPGVHALASLVAAPASTKLAKRLEEGFPPATLAVIDFEMPGGWADIGRTDDGVLRALQSF